MIPEARTQHSSQFTTTKTKTKVPSPWAYNRRVCIGYCVSVRYLCFVLCVTQKISIALKHSSLYTRGDYTPTGLAPSLYYRASASNARY